MRRTPSPLIPLGGSIAFEDVAFRYPNGEQVLEHFNLHVPAGQKLGLIGRTGAGKSTILALLQRLYEPEAGRVLIDEQNIAEVTQYRPAPREIAVVQQDISAVQPFGARELRYGIPDASEAEVLPRPPRWACCTEFIARLPKGFDTIVGERGLKLSGGGAPAPGHRTRLLRNAPIVLLDEATSALDHRLRAARPGGAHAAREGTYGDRHRTSPDHAQHSSTASSCSTADASSRTAYPPTYCGAAVLPATSRPRPVAVGRRA